MQGLERSWYTWTAEMPADVFTFSVNHYNALVSFLIPVWDI